jgi:hypothetical protein
MNAAFTSYEGMAGPGSAVTGGHERPYGTTGTAASQRRQSPDRLARTGQYVVGELGHPVGAHPQQARSCGFDRGV